MRNQLNEFATQTALITEIAARSIFMRAYAALLILALFFQFTMAGFTDWPFDWSCPTWECRTFGDELLICLWIAPFMLQFLPERIRRRHVPETFLLLVVPLATGLRLFNIWFAMFLFFPLFAQIVIGMIDTVAKYRQIASGQKPV